MGGEGQSRLGPFASHSTPGLTGPSASVPTSPQTEPPRKLAPVRSASASCRVLSRHLAHHSHCRPPSAPQKRLQTAANPPIYTNSSPDHRACNSLTPPSSALTPSIGGFGFSFPCSHGQILSCSNRQRDLLSMGGRGNSPEALTQESDGFCYQSWGKGVTNIAERKPGPF